MPFLRSKTRAKGLEEVFPVLLSFIRTWADTSVDDIEVIENASTHEKQELAKDWACLCVGALQDFIRSKRPGEKRKRSSNSSSQSTSRRKKQKRKEVAEIDDEGETASVPDRPEDGTEIDSGQQGDTRTETLPNQVDSGKDNAPSQQTETDTENPSIQDRNQTFPNQSLKDVESNPPPNHPGEEAANESDGETVAIRDESNNDSRAFQNQSQNEMMIAQNPHHGLSEPELTLLERFDIEARGFHDICLEATQIDNYPIDNEAEIEMFLKKANDSCRLKIEEIPPIPIIGGSICHQNSVDQPPQSDPCARFSAHRKAVKGPVDPRALFLQRFHSILMGAYFKNIRRGETKNERTRAIWQLVKNCDKWTMKDFILFSNECILLWDIFEICGLPFLWFGGSLCYFILTTAIFKMKTEFPSYLTTHLRIKMVDVTCTIFQGHSLSWLQELSPPQGLFFINERLTEDAGVAQSSATGVVKIT